MKKEMQSYEILYYEIDLALVEGEKASQKAIKVRNQTVKDLKEIKNYLRISYPSTKFTLTKEIADVGGGKSIEYYSLKMNMNKLYFEDIHIMVAETITYMMVNNVGKNTLNVLPHAALTLNELSAYTDKTNDVEI